MREIEKPEKPIEVSLFTVAASMQIYFNKRTFSDKKNVQSPKDWLGTPTWPPFYCFRTPIWRTWRHVKILQWFARMHNTVVVIGTRQNAMIDRPILHLKLGIPESGIFLLMESGIQVTFKIRTQSSTDKDWNSVPGIRNLRHRIQNPRLSWIHLHRASFQETIYIECLLEDQDLIWAYQDI